MRKNPFAQDMLLTEEELVYVRSEVVKTFLAQVVARKIFPIENAPDHKFYKWYNEELPSEAVIDMDGKAQSDDFPDLEAHDLKWPVIHKEALLNWRDYTISNNGTKLLERTISALTKMVAWAEDRLLISGECLPGWPALGIEGLFTATGRANVAASGVWPTNALDDINLGRSHLEGHGFEGIEPILLGPPAMIKCLDNFMANTDTTYRQALLDNGLISGAIPSSNAYAADCGQDSVVLVIPGVGNFWAAQGVPLTTVTWPDKMGNLHLTVRETITPVIARPTAIYEINTIVCNLP